MAKKLLDFQASITDVKQINPLFSTCKVKVLYTGRNRNMSYISKEAVEKALPSLPNIPIVGEFSEEISDFKGHGGKLDLDSYKFIHTTKPYGVVPESATYEWEEVKGTNGSVREYLVINGCYLWTGRYEEAFSIIEKGKAQSMEIEVGNGRWNEEEEVYQIDNFTFSALCILGDDVEPAFEDASITAYSLDKDSFKQEFTLLLKELKTSLEKDKEESNSMLKQLLEKYSTTVEELTAKGLNFSELSEDELEAKIVEVLEIKEPVDDKKGDDSNSDEGSDDSNAGDNDDAKDDEGSTDEGDTDSKDDEEPTVDFEVLQNKITELESKLEEQSEELETLREFKLNAEKAEHEAKVETLFSNFQLTEEDVNDIDIHAFSIKEIEEKCYAILGRKLATKKDFSLDNKGNVIKVPVGNKKDDNSSDDSEYGGLFEKYNKSKK